MSAPARLLVHPLLHVLSRSSYVKCSNVYFAFDAQAAASVDSAPAEVVLVLRDETQRLGSIDSLLQRAKSSARQTKIDVISRNHSRMQYYSNSKRGVGITTKSNAFPLVHSPGKGRTSFCLKLECFIMFLDCFL